ncbi:jacalin-like lectin [Teredinibacter turnerae]|uniref:jacalin-like lectin n=1 Tax=Teredinibacter turnerae TaxID=2426 RepID=UPI0003724EBB|nr:jacalin-like lectin [Teredinibacter turnerae]
MKKIIAGVLMLSSMVAGAQKFEAGVSGGWGGTPFADNPPTDFSQIHDITLCGGSVVDSISTNIEDVYGNVQSYGKKGGNGGSCSTLYFYSGEYITSVTGRYGSRVDRMVITTNYGRTLSKGGNGGGGDFKYTANDQFQIAGFAGRSGSKLDAVGVIYLRSY